MTAQSRYYTDAQGQEWFAVEVTDDEERLPRADKNAFERYDPGLYSYVLFVPRDSVEITDALACSRAELGPVYVRDMAPESVVKSAQGEILLYLEQLIGVLDGDSVFTESDQGASIEGYRLATLAELKEAGIE